MIPGYLDQERIVGRVIELNGPTDMLLCSACYANFALPVGATERPIPDGDGAAQEKCDECGCIIGEGPEDDDGSEYDIPLEVEIPADGDDDAWPERPRDTALIGSKR